MSTHIPCSSGRPWSSWPRFPRLRSHRTLPSRATMRNSDSQGSPRRTQRSASARVAREVVGMDEPGEEPRFGHELRRRVSEQLLHLWRDVDRPPVGRILHAVGPRDPRDLFDERSQHVPLPRVSRSSRSLRSVTSIMMPWSRRGRPSSSRSTVRPSRWIHTTRPSSAIIRWSMSHGYPSMTRLAVLLGRCEIVGVDDLEPAPRVRVEASGRIPEDVLDLRAHVSEPVPLGPRSGSYSRTKKTTGPSSASSR